LKFVTVWRSDPRPRNFWRILMEPHEVADYIRIGTICVVAVAVAAGLANAALASDDADLSKSKVAGHRNVVMTLPYFRVGAGDSLPDAVRIMAKDQLELDLSEPEVNEIVAFLRSRRTCRNGSSAESVSRFRRFSVGTRGPGFLP
jgi:cytochrome c peroxidase